MLGYLVNHWAMKKSRPDSNGSIEVGDHERKSVEAPRRLCRRCDKPIHSTRPSWMCARCRYLAHLPATIRWRRQHPARQAAIQRRARKRYYHRHPEKWQQDVARRMVREPDVVRQKRRVWARARRCTLSGKLAHAHRVAVRKQFRRRSGGATSMDLLGCTGEYLVTYICQLLKPGMTAENYGSAWWLDHIKPISAFDLRKSCDRAACFHFSNLQPLTAVENMAKGATWDPADESGVVARHRHAEAKYRAYKARK